MLSMEKLSNEPNARVTFLEEKENQKTTPLKMIYASKQFRRLGFDLGSLNGAMLGRRKRVFKRKKNHSRIPPDGEEVISPVLAGSSCERPDLVTRTYRIDSTLDSG